MFRCLLISTFVLRSVSAAILPQALTPHEISLIAREVTAVATTRLLRSAEPYPFFFPGIKFGLEIDFIPMDEIYRLGNGQGSGPGSFVLPKFYVAKKLIGQLETILSFLPNSIQAPLNTWGGILKYTLKDEKEAPYSASLFGGFTHQRGFNSALEASTYETGMVLSKDFVRLRPYLGIGGLLTTLSLDRAYTSSNETEATQFLLHSFLGAEFLLPITLSVQLELFNLTPKMAVFVGFSFS